MKHPTNNQLRALTHIWNSSGRAETVTEEFMLYAASLGLDGVRAWHYEEHSLNYLYEADPHVIREMRLSSHHG